MQAEQVLLRSPGVLCVSSHPPHQCPSLEALPKRLPSEGCHFSQSDGSGFPWGIGFPWFSPQADAACEAFHSPDAQLVRIYVRFVRTRTAPAGT